MFSDTLTLTINSVAKTLNRISQDKYSSEYFLRETEGEFRLRIRNTSYVDKTRNGGLAVDRHNVEVIQTLYPTADRVNPRIRKWYSVFELDQGDTIIDNVNFVVGCNAFITSGNATKMANWES